MFVTDWERTFLHRCRRRRRQSDDHPVLLRVSQIRGSCTMTSQDCKEDVAVFSNEFCRIFLGLMQLYVLERCYGAEPPFSSIGQFQFIKQLAVVRSINCTQFVEKINEKCASAIVKNFAQAFPAKRRVLAFRAAAYPGFRHPVLAC